MSESIFDVVIVGGAVIGSAAAYFLMDQPGFDGSVLVIERDMSFSECATARSLASIRHQFSTPENIRISMFGSQFLRRLGNSTRLGMEKSRVFAVRRPQGVENVQRRAHVRVDLERTVRIRSMGSLGDHVGIGKTVNIGAGGVQFTTEVPLMFGDQLKIALVLTPRDIVVAGGTVVRIEDQAAAPIDGTRPAEPPKVLSKVAMRFDKISEADQERISVHILAAHRKLSAAIAVAAVAAVDPAPEDAPAQG